ncbi:MAG: universal stress protein [Crocosphaera sp.]|nr:universal stress protein [Crocosphaera sp.]
MMSKKILVPLASIDNSETVFQEALHIAKQEDSILKLFHCINSEVYFTPYGTFTTSELDTLFPKLHENLEQEREKVIQWLTKYSQKASLQGVNSEWDYTMGNPSSCIIKVARNWPADLIIMGRRGLTGLSEILLGSVSNYVFHHAPCNILLIQ